MQLLWRKNVVVDLLALGRDLEVTTVLVVLLHLEQVELYVALGA